MKPDLGGLNFYYMPNLQISLIQTVIHWEDKTANLECFGKKIEGIPDKTELIILPEMFSTGFSMKRNSLAETMAGPYPGLDEKNGRRKRGDHYRQYDRQRR